MLVLSRKIGERIHIGGEIFIEVRRVAGSRVTIAVSAPESVRILRGELFEVAGSFDVLDDAAVDCASATDTVIMEKHSPERESEKTSVTTGDSRC